MCPSANRSEDGLNRSSVRYLFQEEYLMDLGGSRIFTRPPNITNGKCMVWIGIAAISSPCCSKYKHIRSKLHYQFNILTSASTDCGADAIARCKLRFHFEACSSILCQGRSHLATGWRQRVASAHFNQLQKTEEELSR